MFTYNGKMLAILTFKSCAAVGNGMDLDVNRECCLHYLALVVSADAMNAL